MGQGNSKRISHDVNQFNNSYRDDQLSQILNDIDEDMTGGGYSEIQRVNGPFVTKIILWKDSTKTLKRYEVGFTRIGAFISQIVKTIYSNTNDNFMVSRITMNVTRTGNKFVAYVDASTENFVNSN